MWKTNLKKWKSATNVIQVVISTVMNINNKLLLLNFNHCNDSRKCLINYSVYSKICQGKNHSGVGNTEMDFGSL